MDSDSFPFKPHYDSLLVKCTVSGTTYEVARRKMLRALVEFRIRGVKVRIYIALLFVYTDQLPKDQYPFLIPTPYSRCLHRRQNLDNSSFAYLLRISSFPNFSYAVHRRYTGSFQARADSKQGTEVVGISRRLGRQWKFHQRTNCEFPPPSKGDSVLMILARENLASRPTLSSPNFKAAKIPRTDPLSTHTFPAPLAGVISLLSRALRPLPRPFANTPAV